MHKIAITFLLLQSCSNHPSKPDNPDTRFFSDASDCFNESTRKEYVKVPVSAQNVIISNTVVEVPLGNDAGAFRLCMKYKGHLTPSPQVNTTDYLNVSKACMQEASASSTPNETYANCVKHWQLTIESITPDGSK